MKILWEEECWFSVAKTFFANGWCFFQKVPKKNIELRGEKKQIIKMYYLIYHFHVFFIYFDGYLNFFFMLKVVFFQVFFFQSDLVVGLLNFNLNYKTYLSPVKCFFLLIFGYMIFLIKYTYNYVFGLLWFVWIYILKEKVEVNWFGWNQFNFQVGYFSLT